MLHRFFQNFSNDAQSRQSKVSHKLRRFKFLISRQEKKITLKRWARWLIIFELNALSCGLPVVCTWILYSRAMKNQESEKILLQFYWKSKRTKSSFGCWFDEIDKRVQFEWSELEWISVIWGSEDNSWMPISATCNVSQSRYKIINDRPLKPQIFLLLKSICLWLSVAHGSNFSSVWNAMSLLVFA